MGPYGSLEFCEVARSQTVYTTSEPSVCAQQGSPKTLASTSEQISAMRNALAAFATWLSSLDHLMHHRQSAKSYRAIGSWLACQP